MMQSKAERDRRNLVILVTLGLLILGTLFEAWVLRKGTPAQHTLFLDFSAAILPNLLAGLIGVIAIDGVARWLLRDADRHRYLAALDPVRGALREARVRGSIQPPDVREVMGKVVAAVSSLYFSADRPRALKKDAEVIPTPLDCDICSLKCEMKEGLCGFCGDLYEGWHSAQRLTRPSSDNIPTL